jgi:hypothetical protein
MQLGNEKEKKINAACVCRIMCSAECVCVCVEMTDPYPVSGACSSRLILFLIPGAAPVIKSREAAAPAAAAIIKPFSVFYFIKYNTDSLSVSLFLRRSVFSEEARNRRSLECSPPPPPLARSLLYCSLREDIVYHRSHLAFQRGRPACEIPATMTKIPHGVHSKLKIVIHAVTPLLMMMLWPAGDATRMYKN